MTRETVAAGGRSINRVAGSLLLQGRLLTVEFREGMGIKIILQLKCAELEGTRFCKLTPVRPCSWVRLRRGAEVK